MRIPCPYCGERDVREFVYHGDATVQRPDPEAADALERFTAYVYLRDNPAGAHRELWYHGAGCQSWLIATRDTRTHEIAGVEPASRFRTDSQPSSAPSLPASGAGIGRGQTGEVREGG